MEPLPLPQLVMTLPVLMMDQLSKTSLLKIKLIKALMGLHLKMTHQLLKMEHLPKMIQVIF